MTRTAQGRPNNVALWLMFCLPVALCLGLFIVPAFIIRPFSFQSPRALLLALTVHQMAQLWTLVFGAFALVPGIILWRRMRWSRIVVVLGVCLCALSATMAHTDYFEWMFHPVASPGFESSDHAKLDPSEMVLAVRFSAESRAYPIRAMAYHHVVNDVVAGVPIVVTY